MLLEVLLITENRRPNPTANLGNRVFSYVTVELLILMFHFDRNPKPETRNPKPETLTPKQKIGRIVYSAVLTVELLTLMLH